MTAGPRLSPANCRSSTGMRRSGSHLGQCHPGPAGPQRLQDCLEGRVHAQTPGSRAQSSASGVRPLGPASRHSVTTKRVSASAAQVATLCNRVQQVRSPLTRGGYTDYSYDPASLRFEGGNIPVDWVAEIHGIRNGIPSFFKTLQVLVKQGDIVWRTKFRDCYREAF